MNKIVDNELHNFLSSKTQEKKVIIVQPVLVQRFYSNGDFVDVPLTRGQLAKRCARLSKEIEMLIGKKPNWLKSAKAFQIEVTPAQLEIIERLPLVRAIWQQRKVRL